MLYSLFGLLWTENSPLRGRRKGTRTLRLETLEEKFFDRIGAGILKGRKEAQLLFTHKVVRDLLEDAGASRSGARTNALLERLGSQGILTAISRARLRTGKHSVTYSLTFYGFLKHVLAKMQSPDRVLSQLHLAASSGYLPEGAQTRLPYDLEWIEDQSRRSDNIGQCLSVAGDHYGYPLFAGHRALAAANPGQSFVIHGTKVSLRSPVFYIYQEVAKELLTRPPFLPGHTALIEQFEEERRQALKQLRQLSSIRKSRWFKRAREREARGELPFFVRVGSGKAERTVKGPPKLDFNMRELTIEQWLQEQQERYTQERRDLDKMLQSVRSGAFSDERWKKGYARAFLRTVRDWGIIIPKNEELTALFEGAIDEQRTLLDQQEKDLEDIQRAAGLDH